MKDTIKINKFLGMKLEETKRFHMEHLAVEVTYKKHEYDIHILPPRSYQFFPSEEIIEIFAKSGKRVRRTNPQNQIYKEIRDFLFSFDMSRNRTFFKKELFDILYPHHLYDEMLMVEMNTDDMEIFLFGLGYKLIYTPVIKKSPYGGLYDDYISIHNGERLRVHYYVTGNFENMKDETVDCIPYKIEASTNEMYKLLYPYYQRNIADRYQIISDIDEFMLEHGFQKIGSKNYKTYASSWLDFYNDYQSANQIYRIFYDVHRKEYEEEITEEHGCSVFDIVFLTTQNNSEPGFQNENS